MLVVAGGCGAPLTQTLNELRREFLSPAFTFVTYSQEEGGTLQKYRRFFLTLEPNSLNLMQLLLLDPLDAHRLTGGLEFHDVKTQRIFAYLNRSIFAGVIVAPGDTLLPDLAIVEVEIGAV